MNVSWQFAICFAFVCLAGCPGTPRDHSRPHGHHDTTIAVSAQSDTLLFNAVGSGGRDLYVLSLTGLKVTRIADTPDYETAPSFSPDGQRIVYAAGIRGDRADHLFSIRRDGSQKTQLTNIDANDTSPRYSPDGKTIVFARDKTYIWGGLASNWDPGGVICLIDADGSNFRQLTPDETFAFEPHFNAAGTHVIYSTANARMSMPIDQSSAPRLLPGPLDAIASSDEEFIAYSLGQYSPDLKVFLANADGTSERCLTPKLGGCYKPVFSPSGGQLYFLREEWPNGATGSPKFSVWEITIAGPAVRMLANSSLFDAPLSWKP